ncbi:MAG: hypothetical protein IPN36_11890 [Bacteroidetes bacterium]|nr:hypothetical protein [Bacteroidota bacterium]
MTWTDRISDFKTYKIQSASEEGLTKDFINLFAEIQGDEFTDKPQLLISINATNGNIFISAFDNKRNEIYDDKGVLVELTEFWEENQNAYDFDEITINALKTAYIKSEQTTFNLKYEAYYQTEDESKAKRLSC